MDTLRVSRLRVSQRDGLAGEGQRERRRNFRFLPGRGPAAERSWHFQIGARAAPPPGPSPRDRADRRRRLGPALLARKGGQVLFSREDDF